MGNTKEEEGKEQITETLDIPEDDVVQDSDSSDDEEEDGEYHDNNFWKVDQGHSIDDLLKEFA